VWEFLAILKRDFRFVGTVKIQVEVFWVVTPWTVAVGYQHFEGPYCSFTSEDRSNKVF
jgi:hypothetical protein